MGSFFLGGTKLKNKRLESQGGGRESDGHTVDNQVTSVPPTQNLALTTSVSAWPNSRLMDMQSAHGDIDLMRG